MLITNDDYSCHGHRRATSAYLLRGYVVCSYLASYPGERDGGGPEQVKI